jgi:heme exporter protein D
MSPRLRFWKKVFETPVEIVVCFVAGALGTISIPLVILWNLTVERKFILASIQDEIEREERLNKRPESDPPPNILNVGHMTAKDTFWVALLAMKGMRISFIMMMILKLHGVVS